MWNMGKGRNRRPHRGSSHQQHQRQPSIEELMAAAAEQMYREEACKRSRPLRFAKGARVECRMRDGWTIATVLEHHPAFGFVYLCEIEGTSTITRVPRDIASLIRRARLIALIRRDIARLIAEVLRILYPTQAEYEARHGGATSDDAGNGTGAGTGTGNGAGNGAGTDGAGNDDAVPEEPSPADPFETLGLTAGGEGVDASAVSSAYKKLAMKWHPDKNGGSEESHIMMQRLNSAKASCLDALRPPGEHDEDAAGQADEAPDHGSAAEGEDEAARMEREFREFHRRRAAERKRVRKEVERSRAAARNRQQQQQHSAQHGGKKKKAPKTKVADENPMSCCHHPIACAIRLKAFDALGELLSFEFSPLGTLDAFGHNALHYAAHAADLRCCNLVVQRCGPHWWRACLATNTDGKRPHELIPAVATMSELPASGAADASTASEDTATSEDRALRTRLLELFETALAHEKKVQAAADARAAAARRRLDPRAALKATALPAAAFIAAFVASTYVPGVKWLLSTMLALAAAFIVGKWSPVVR